jgi:hypothetical protein
MRLAPLNITVPDLPRNTPPYASRATPADMPKLHWLGACIGGRNSGKTTSVLKFLKMYIGSKSYDRIFWISPTASREDKVRDFQTYSEKHKVQMDIYDDYSDVLMQEIIDWIRDQIDEYKDYLQKLEIWKKFVRAHSVDEMSYDELIELEKMDFREPTTDYKNGYPSFCIAIDDSAGRRDVFNPSCKGVMSNFAILHRHLSCSLIFLMQIVANGVPRGIRSNISLWMLFGTKSATLKKAVAEELAFRVDANTLIRAWELATKDKPHDFLMMNYDHPTLQGMFRKNFDQEIQLDDEPTEARINPVEESPPQIQQ